MGRKQLIRMAAAANHGCKTRRQDIRQPRGMLFSNSQMAKEQRKKFISYIVDLFMNMGLR
jgi:hypothetical protein